jgi:hypothetical protein
MKYIIILVFLLSSVNGSVLSSTIQSVDNENNVATIQVDKVDVGMSGFVVREFNGERSSILKNVVVESFDVKSGKARLKLSEFNDLQSTALPQGKWTVQKGDAVVLAFAYTSALLIAPNSDIYYKITKSTKTIDWIHPDIFAVLLSKNGHPTPLKEDFKEMSLSTYVGLVFIYLDKKLYTLDAKTFKILNTSDALLEQQNVQLPFYSRIDEIDASWFGEGSDELESYEPHYYELMIEYNPDNKDLKNSYQKSKSKEVE